MLTAVLLLALVGFAGGYLAGHATIWADVRTRVERRRDVAYALHFGEADTLNPPLGAIASDPKTLSFPMPRLERWRWLIKAKATDLVTCSICAGWWAIAGAMVWWYGVSRWTGTTTPYGAATAPLVWLAACALHTVAMSAAGRLGLFGNGEPESTSGV
jgi:hypothetical protein